MADDKERKDAEEKAKADAARADSDKLDMILRGIDSVRKDVEGCNSRMDAFEMKEKEKADAVRKDAEEKEKSEKEEKEKADKARKDGEDPDEAKRLAADKAKKDSDDAMMADKAKKDAEEEEKKKADAARADSAGDLKALIKAQSEQIAALAARIPKDLTDADLGSLTAAQSRADSVFTAFGERAPRFMSSEPLSAYERRLANGLKKHSDRFKDVNLDLLGADAFTPIQESIYADALVRARNPNDIAKGKMREVTRTTPSGHTVTEFFGDESAHFVGQFSRAPRMVNGIRMAN